MKWPGWDEIRSRISDHQMNLFIGFLFAAFLVTVIGVRWLLEDISEGFDSKPTPAAMKNLKEPLKPKSQSPTQRVSEGVEVRQEWKEPILCQHIRQGRLYVPRGYMIPVLRGEMNSIVLPKALAPCAAEYAVNTLAFTNFDHKTGLPWRYWLEQPVRYITVSNYSHAKEFEERAMAEGFETKQRLRFFSEQLTEFGGSTQLEPLLYIRFELGTRQWSPSHFGAPLIHPLAQTLSAGQVKKMLEDRQVTLLDLRRKDVEPRRGISGSVKWPVPWRSVRLQFRSPGSLAHVDFDKEALAKIPRTTPLVVYAENEKNAAPYNALSWLYMQGYRKLYYFRGGMSEWLRQPVATPDRAGAVRVIDSRELQKLLRHKPQIIDVRRDQRYYSGTIPGAQQIYISPDLDEEGIKKRLKGLRLTGRVVVVGHNELDWSAYRTARVLDQYAKSKIYWLRRGYSQWRFAAKVLDLNIEKPKSKKSPLVKAKSRRVKPAYGMKDRVYYESVPAKAE